MDVNGKHKSWFRVRFLLMKFIIIIINQLVYCVFLSARQSVLTIDIGIILHRQYNDTQSVTHTLLMNCGLTSYYFKLGKYHLFTYTILVYMIIL